MTVSIPTAVPLPAPTPPSRRRRPRRSGRRRDARAPGRRRSSAALLRPSGRVLALAFLLLVVVVRALRAAGRAVQPERDQRAPPQRARRRGRTGSAPTTSAATSSAGSSPARPSRCASSLASVGDRVRARDPDRAVLGVHRRQDRHRDHALRRRRPQLPGAGAGAGHRGRPRPERRSRGDRDHDRDHAAGVHPAGPGLGAGGAARDLHRGVAIDRRADTEDPAPSDPARTSARRSSSPASLALGGALLAEAGLSFLGLSVQPPEASWGSMLRHAYDVALFTYPWQLVFPGRGHRADHPRVQHARRRFPRRAESVDPAASRRRDRTSRRGTRKRARPTEVVAPASSRVAAPRRRRGPARGRRADGRVRRRRAATTAVDDVSFDVQRGRCSGWSGRVARARPSRRSRSCACSIRRPRRIVSGSVRFEDQDLLRHDFDELRRVPGASMAMVFQDPMSSLNPASTDQAPAGRGVPTPPDPVDRPTARHAARSCSTWSASRRRGAG